VEKLLDALGDDELSVRDLMARMGLKHRPSFRALYLNPAMRQGFVEMTIPETPNSSKQKYSVIK